MHTSMVRRAGVCGHRCDAQATLLLFPIGITAAVVGQPKQWGLVASMGIGNRCRCESLPEPVVWS